jgi:hypothetical protein
MLMLMRFQYKLTWTRDTRDYDIQINFELTTSGYIHKQLLGDGR